METDNFVVEGIKKMVEKLVSLIKSKDDVKSVAEKK
jgi:hypothetical protein